MSKIYYLKDVVEVSLDGPLEAIARENRRRNQALGRYEKYDPIKGLGCVGRRAVAETPDGRVRLPVSMVRDGDYSPGMGRNEYVKLRCRHDFEFWASTCATIRDKSTGEEKPFVLNAPQRRVLRALEDMRVGGKAIRMIILKARQWGGSTLVQLYMSWIQICLRRNWNSLICAHLKDTSSAIRGMYSLMLSRYPEEFWSEDGRPEFRPYERTQNIRIIEGRGCKVTISSSETQDSVRGLDIAMAHLSEVAFWRDSLKSTPEQLIRSICGSINLAPMTLIVLESTANGVGDFFHREWLRSVDGKSDKVPVFVPWYEIEIYRRPVSHGRDMQLLVESLDEYEQDLWRRGLTLEMIAWFHYKRREYPTLTSMLSEYPTTPTEAFAAVDRNVFNPDDCEALRAECCEPQRRGDLLGNGIVGAESLKGLRLVESRNGALKIWREPIRDDNHNYVVAVDIGGRSSQSDWSVIVVVDKNGGQDGVTPEVVACWRGHCDHDLLAFKAARVARWYSDALLVFESNTLETEGADDPSRYILKQVRECYNNMYVRPSDEGSGVRLGFHTNRQTKSMIINRLVAMVRDRGYIEHEHEAVNELLDYEVTPSGGFSARRGCHDDLLMARAIALHVSATMLPKNVAGRGRYWGCFE